MSRGPSPLKDGAANLRARAEKQLQTSAVAGPPHAEAEADRLVTELKIHQIELEMQNASLERTRGELEAALARYTELYDFAPVGYFTLDGDGTVLSSNLSGADLLGVPRSGLLGRPFGAFLSPGSRVPFVFFLGRTLDGGKRETCEVALALEGMSEPVERVIRVEGTASPSGKEIHAAVLDVTEQRAAEAEVRRMNEGLETAVRARTSELEAANAELEAFTRSVSHDLRAPLRAISGFAQVLSDDCSDRLSPQDADYLRRIRAGAHKMGVLIDDLLRLSRTGKCGLEVASVDLALPCREILAELASGSPERRVETVVAELLPARGDAQLLRQMLENLLGNAWKFTAKTEGARIEVGSSLEAEGWLDLFVRDNGAGFDMAHVGKLFRPFQRLHQEDQYPGTGIGLAIVDRIVRYHGGSVRAEGVEGGGATIHVRLPLAGEPA